MVIHLNDLDAAFAGVDGSDLVKILTPNSLCGFASAVIDR